MRRILVVAALLVACLAAGAAYGIEANGGPRIHYGSFAPSGTYIIEYVYYTPDRPTMPVGFTLHTKDGSAFWFQRRYDGGLRDTVSIAVPAGLSYTIPSPGGVAHATNDSTYITIFVGGHTDTLFSLPWDR